MDVLQHCLVIAFVAFVIGTGVGLLIAAVWMYRAMADAGPEIHTPVEWVEQTESVDESEANELADRMMPDIAYHACRSDIESNCFSGGGTQETGWWWNTSLADDDAAYWVYRAVDYLELRGLIERDPERPHLVRILDQVEPAPKSVERSRPATPVGWSDTDWIKHLQEQETPHPLAGLHINQGSMDGAADAYEADYKSAHDHGNRS